jgi:hypothetical protein
MRSFTTILDTAAHSDHRFCFGCAGFDLGECPGAPAPFNRPRLLHRHASLERGVFHTGNAGISENPTGCSAFRRAFDARRKMEILELVQRTTQCRVVPLFSLGSLRSESNMGVKDVLNRIHLRHNNKRNEPTIEPFNPTSSLTAAANRPSNFTAKPSEQKSRRWSASRTALNRIRPARSHPGSRTKSCMPASASVKRL